LADEKLVEVRPRHGARVLGVNADDIADIYDIVADIEASAARRVAARGLTDAELKVLEGARAKMEAATGEKDFATWINGDNLFHETLIAAAGNPRLLDIFKGLMAQVHRARLMTSQGRAVPTQSNQEHTDLLAALKAGKPDLAHQILYDHRMRSRASLVDLVRRLPCAV
jgi:DNA-binding GntR family transcriptional regulator